MGTASNGPCPGKKLTGSKAHNEQPLLSFGSETKTACSSLGTGQSPKPRPCIPKTRNLDNGISVLYMFLAWEAPNNS